MNPATRTALAILLVGASRAFACCAVAPGGHLAVNADQTVILLWDAERQTQHFIRQADFATNGGEVGFIVPSPSRPEVEESGDAAFARLDRITAPPPARGGVPFGCSAAPPIPVANGVRVVEQKRVAGFDAAVLTAHSGHDLAAWLQAHGYPWSTAVADWAKPYLGGNWHFTALKVARDGRGGPRIQAGALRISFQTETPLFPYREPESATAAAGLAATDRLLRVFFIAEARYRGEIDPARPWSGKVMWSGDITAHRAALLADLGLPSDAGPGPRWWLTEFEDHWPYAKAAGDLSFRRDPNQREVHRLAGSPPKDAAMVAMLATACLLVPFQVLRRRGRPCGAPSDRPASDSP